MISAENARIMYIQNRVNAKEKRLDGLELKYAEQLKNIENSIHNACLAGNNAITLGEGPMSFEDLGDLLSYRYHYDVDIGYGEDSMFLKVSW